ncbi:MAG TPA: universal stress protein [Caulobacteraceae bacterium]|nr:universal stress protein [Caulobacteraceae bacterium]
MERPLILHPTDLGPASDGAFRHALRIAVAERGSLRLVHVHQADGESAAKLDAFPHVRDTLVRWGMLQAGAPASAIAERLGVHVSKAEVVAARAEPGLETLVDHEAPDLIVLGTRGPGGKDEPGRISFAETLARHARTPALIVPIDVAGFVGAVDGVIRLNNILMPVTRPPDPGLALAIVSRLVNALRVDPRLTLLHVGPQAKSPRLDLPESDRYHLMTGEGPVVDAIVKAAEETSADLIVMATEGHNSLPDDLGGDTTEHVLRRARRPVLAAPVG